MRSNKLATGHIRQAMGPHAARGPPVWHASYRRMKKFNVRKSDPRTTIDVLLSMFCFSFSLIPCYLSLRYFRLEESMHSLGTFGWLTYLHAIKCYIYLNFFNFFIINVLKNFYCILYKSTILVHWKHLMGKKRLPYINIWVIHRDKWGVLIGLR